MKRYRKGKEVWLEKAEVVRISGVNLRCLFSTLLLLYIVLNCFKLFGVSQNSSLLARLINQEQAIAFIMFVRLPLPHPF